MSALSAGLSPITGETPAAVGAVIDLDQLLVEVRGLIIDVIGEEYILDLEIDMDTSFNDDLEIESIEFVSLAEKLHEQYGERVDFVGWFAELELDQIIALTVGQLVEFIAGCLS